MTQQSYRSPLTPTQAPNRFNLQLIQAEVSKHLERCGADHENLHAKIQDLVSDNQGLHTRIDELEELIHALEEKTTQLKTQKTSSKNRSNLHREVKVSNQSNMYRESYRVHVGLGSQHVLEHV